MTKHEIKLIEMIHEQNNPEQALMTSLKIILSYLEQHESFGEPSLVDSRELV